MKLAIFVLALIFVASGFYEATIITPTTGIPFVSSFAATGASSSVWWVGASSTDSSALPNTGVRGTFPVISFQVTGCLAFWVSDDLTNNVWGQVGYYICDGTTPIAFYQIWNLNSNSVLNGGSSSVSAGDHTFSMYLQSGTTWAYAVDGTVLGTYDMGAASSSSSYPVQALSEEQATSIFAFPSVTFTNAMEVMKAGSWSPVQTAKSYGTGWGVQGAMQNSGLQNDQISIGGAIGTISQGSTLWNAGIVSTSSSTTGTTSSTSTTTMPPATSTVTVTSTVTAPTVTQTSTSTVTSTRTVPASTSTSTVTSTQTKTQTSTMTSTLTLPATTTTTTVTSTAPVGTATTTQTSTTTSTVTSTVSGQPTTSTATASTAQPTVTQTSTSTVTQTVTSSSTVTSTLEGGPPVTTTSTSTVTMTETSTLAQPTTVTKITASTIILPGPTTTTILPGPTTTATATLPASTTTETTTVSPSTTTVMSTGTRTSTETLSRTVTITATTTVCVSGSPSHQVSCPSAGNNPAAPVVPSGGYVLVISVLGASVAVFAMRKVMIAGRGTVS